MQKKEKVKNYIYIAALAVSMLLLVFFELFKKKIFVGENADATYALATRAIGGVLCLVLVFYCSYHNILKIKGRGFLRALLFTLPCWAVALNNFPIIPFFSGRAYIDAAASAIIFYAVQCLFVGFFEEMAFRGCIFMLVLGRRRKRRLDVFWSIVISSAIFGVIHLVNILVGASPGAVLLQVGYSFLIGGMCSVVLMKTGSIWHCVLLHAVYNFCGGAVPELGGGTIWDTPTVVITAVLAVAVTVYIVVALVRIDPNELGYLFGEENKAIDEKSEVSSHSDL
ncbi:MAG: CPBP family intramembrane metalloprotease [Clostridia bacterium]|nr:CPBP family intramembrane metalloprotease [Clostridia bacterium]